MLTVVTHRPSPALQECELTFLESEKIDYERALLQHHAFSKINAALPKTLAMVTSLGYSVTTADISEFIKAEAGLTCMYIPFFDSTPTVK